MNNNIEFKIQHYISRLYQYKALENLVVFILFFTAYYLLYLLIESIFYLSSISRTFLFYFTLVASTFWLFIKIIYPLGQSYFPKFQISIEQASKQIGNSNSGINDRLLNLIQLKKLGNDALIVEGINQLENELFSFDFLQTLSLQNLKLFVKLLVIPSLFFVILSVVNFDGIVLNPTNRILSFNDNFKKPLNFEIAILNDSLDVVEGDDLILKFKINSTPKQTFFVFVDGKIYEPNLLNGIFSHQFTNVDSGFNFKIGVEHDKSYSYDVNVIDRPKIKSLQLHYLPPKYTGISKKVFTNLAEVSVVEGSSLKWEVVVNGKELVDFSIDDSIYNFINSDFSNVYSLIADSTFYYSILVSNKILKYYISLDYQINTIPDSYPKIQVQSLLKERPSVGVHSFNISASDDYGVSKIGYQIFKSNKLIYTKSSKVHIKSISNKNFVIDSRNFNFNGDVMLKFFVKDNDGIHGSKLTYSSPIFLNILSDKDLFVNNQLLRDSLVINYSDKLNKKVDSDKMSNEFNKIDNGIRKEVDKLNDLKDIITKSIEEKKALKSNLQSINDKDLLEEIEKAIIAQQELLKEINEALNNLEKSKSEDSKSDELKKKNDFHENKTLSFLRKIAANDLLKKAIKDAKELDELINQINIYNNSSLQKDINKSIQLLEDKLNKYSKLKGNDSLEKELNKDTKNISEENNSQGKPDADSMKNSSQNIIKSLQKSTSSSMGGGDSVSVDIEELQYLFYSYLSLSFSEENLIREFDISSSTNQISQYNLLKTLTVLNDRLYNFAISNSHFTRASFDLIYPLQGYSQKISSGYDDDNSYKLNQRQRELLSDINSVTDLLSDILDQLQNAEANSSSSGDGNERQQSTPQDLLDQQEKLNSQSSPKDGKSQEGMNSEQFSDDEISDIIKKQEEIRNKFNKLNGDGTNKFDEEVNKLKKALLMGRSKAEIKKHQDKLVRLLKDFRGEAKEEDNKRNSNTSNQIFNNSDNLFLSTDSIFNKDENLNRDALDYKDYYDNKFKNIQ